MKCMTENNRRKGVKEMQNYIAADEVKDELGISKGKAYQIIRGLNEELREKGFLTIAGKVSRKYFEERIYGYERGDGCDCS